MSLLIPCSACGERTPGKLAHTTWAWWRADNQRVAYRQRLCITCFATTVAPMEVASREFTGTCPACGTDSTTDMDPVYCTTYPAGVGRVRLELALCPTCAVEIRNRAQVGAVRLEDREDSFGGRGPQTDDAWAALGIQPR